MGETEVPATEQGPHYPSGRAPVACLGQLHSSTALAASPVNRPFLPPVTASAATNACASFVILCWPLLADPPDCAAAHKKSQQEN